MSRQTISAGKGLPAYEAAIKAGKGLPAHVTRIAGENVARQSLAANPSSPSPTIEQANIPDTLREQHR